MESTRSEDLLEMSDNLGKRIQEPMTAKINGNDDERRNSRTSRGSGVSALDVASARISDLAGNCSRALRSMGGISDAGDNFQLGRSSHKEPKTALEPKIFVDAAAMKEKVRQNLTKPKYTVTDYYKTSGYWQKIARHTIFENLTLAVIAFNAIWIAVDTDYNTSEMLLDAHPVFQVAENMFCTYFSFEWLVRFMSFKRKRDGCKDAWFMFDSLLVMSMVLETWALTVVALTANGGSGSSVGNASILRIARLLRLSRMARMARLLRAMPELMVLIKGMLAATRSVFFTLCLLILIIYVFAIAFTQLCADTSIGSRYFEKVPASMYTLLVHGALLDDVSTISAELGESSFVFAMVFFLFSLLAALTVMNMLIGVLCEVVSAVAATEKEEMLVGYVNEKLRQVVCLLDTDGDRQISKKEFVEILENAEAARALQEVGVDVVGLIDFADFIFEDDNLGDHGRSCERELSFGDFMEVVLQLRGSNNATVKDIVDLRKFMRRALVQMNAQMLNTQKAVSRCTVHTAQLGKRIDVSNKRELRTTLRGSVGLGSATVGDAINLSRTNSYTEEASDQQEAFDSFVVDENGDSPKAPLLTPGAQLLQGRASENQRLFSEGAEALPNHREFVALKGQWRPLEYKIAAEADGNSNSTSAQCENDVFLSDSSFEKALVLEMEELRGRMAHVGEFLRAGIDEFHKLQEGLVGDMPKGISSDFAELDNRHFDVSKNHVAPGREAEARPCEMTPKAHVVENRNVDEKHL